MIKISIFCLIMFIGHMYWGIFSSYEFTTGNEQFAFCVITMIWGFAGAITGAIHKGITP